MKRSKIEETKQKLFSFPASKHVFLLLIIKPVNNVKFHKTLLDFLNTKYYLFLCLSVFLSLFVPVSLSSCLCLPVFRSLPFFICFSVSLSLSVYLHVYLNNNIFISLDLYFPVFASLSLLDFSLGLSVFYSLSSCLSYS
jgi:hypothetical protein